MRSVGKISGVNIVVRSLLRCLEEAGDEVYPKEAIYETRLD